MKHAPLIFFTIFFTIYLKLIYLIYNSPITEIKTRYIHISYSGIELKGTRIELNVTRIELNVTRIELK
jgi:hypothetical protein